MESTLTLTHLGAENGAFAVDPLLAAAVSSFRILLVAKYCTPFLPSQSLEADRS